MYRQTLHSVPGPRHALRGIHSLAAGLCALLLAPAAWPASLDISDSPLFLASGVRPNVFFELDDSGSMDWEILTKKYWSYCEYDRDSAIDPYGFVGDVCNDNLLDNGRWQSHTGTDTVDFEYIYENGDASYSVGCTGSDSQALYTCDGNLASNTPYHNDWRVLSSDLNVLYYDPKQDYKPWQGPCDSSETACVDADFSNARSNPRNGSDGYSVRRNLNNFTWEVWVDDRGYTGNHPFRGDDINVTSTANGMIDLWDSHRSYRIDGNSIIVTETSYIPDATGLHPSVTTPRALSDAECESLEVYDPGNSSTCIDQVKQNVANWYQYARKRQFIAKAGISAVMSAIPGFRYGLDTINETSNFVEVPGGLGNYSAHNDSLLDELYSFAWPARGTPLRLGLQRAGDYFDHDGASNLSLTNPVEYSCQKNFSVLLTDGYWNGDPPGVGNVDGDSYEDTSTTPSTTVAISDSVADVARLYYNHDLDTGMGNDVEPDASDPATYQHMVTYTLAFGVEGNLRDTDPPGTEVDDNADGIPDFGKGSGWPNPALTESDSWGDPTSCSGCAEKIDDLWHAAYNARGGFISASTPGSAVAGLKKTLRNIQSRTGSASSVALNSGVIQAGSKIFQARFIDTDWHGELLSIPVASDGTPDTGSAIEAGARIQPADDRIMYTYNGKKGVLFEWTSSGTDLSNDQQDDLNTDASGVEDSLGMMRLAWLRGNQSNEKQNGGVFRNRPVSILADIVNSAPAYVGAPEARYPNTWGGNNAPENCSGCQYSTFKQNNQSRTPMVYVGTNGGTLNGFNAEFIASPVEKLAYVPGKVFNNLSQLMDTEYSHRYYVDGSPAVVDAFFDKKWHTVLAGGLNRGGQGIYALDVTNPSNFAATDTAADNVVLWEFTDEDDEDLGFSYSRPAIVRLHNGKWAAVFGNGYNNRDDDGNQSSTGHAVLYIVDIKDGKLIKKIDTGVGSTTTPNGLATPAVVDSNGDFIADSVYAGDLEGNLWKFDLTDKNPSKWGVAFSNSTSGDPEPLYIARDSAGNRQPITARPDVGRGPNGLYSMVFFGTGLYLQAADLADTSEQTFYGILDTGTAFTGRSGLAEQTVIFQANVVFDSISIPVRVTSDNVTAARGWFMDLPDSGERSISNPLLRTGRIIFTTVLPDANPCNSGGKSWLMELNALTGSRLTVSPFDLNNDSAFNFGDYVVVNFDVDGDGDIDGDDILPASGKGFGSLIPTPGVLSDAASGKEYKYTPNSSGGLEVTVENPGVPAVGRQSWGQLR